MKDLVRAEADHLSLPHDEVQMAMLGVFVPYHFAVLMLENCSFDRHHWAIT